MMRLIRGDDLTPSQRQAVLRAYVHRNTVEKPAPWHVRHIRLTDEEWLREHAFYITSKGQLCNRHSHCEPAFLAEANPC